MFDQGLSILCVGQVQKTAVKAHLPLSQHATVKAYCCKTLKIEKRLESFDRQHGDRELLELAETWFIVQVKEKIDWRIEKV